MFLQLFSLTALLLSEPKSFEKRNSTTYQNPALKTDIAQACVDSRLRAGKCVALDKCPDMVEEFYAAARKTSYGIDFQTFVSNSICGFDGNNFLICCRTRFRNQSTPVNPTLAQYQNNPIIFGTPSLPAGAASSPSASSNVLLFAPLGGYNSVTQAPLPPITYPAPTPPTSNRWPPVIYPPVTGGGNVYPNSNPVIFQPGAQTSATTYSPGVFQPVPIPGQGQSPTTAPTGGGGLISQPVPQPITAATTTTPNQAPQIGGWDNTCGISRGTTNRVVGGVEARKGTYPWIAALGYRDDYDPTALKFLCAGSLISAAYVITSAHCVNSNLLLVRLGAHDISNPAEPNARDYRIKRTVTHDGFDLKSISNDIALIELSQSVAMTNFIAPICLPEASSFLTQEFVGMNPFIAGWGARKHQGATSNVLLDAQVPIISRKTCEQNYRTIFNFVQFSEKLICAGNSNVDACQGDSGGPLMLPQMTGGTYYYYLIGVVSYGYECARTGFPGVYTRVAAYMPWIKQNMI